MFYSHEINKIKATKGMNQTQREENKYKLISLATREESKCRS